MNSKSIRVLVIDADPSGGEDALRSQLEAIPGVEIVGIAHSQPAAFNQVEKTKPDIMLINQVICLSS